MTRSLGLVISLFFLGGCAQQDAALLVTFAGQWRIPQDGDQLAAILTKIDLIDWLGARVTVR